MGWLFEYHDRGRKNFLADITSKSHFGEDYTPIKSRVIGNNVWQAVRHDPTGVIFIHLDLIAKQRDGGWGYKGMSEDAGPYQCNCPLSLLELCTSPSSEYAKVWREDVRKYHARKKATPKPASGMVVRVGENKYQLLEPLAPRRGWMVKSIDTGVTYRMPATRLNEALARIGEAA